MHAKAESAGCLSDFAQILEVCDTHRAYTILPFCYLQIDPRPVSNLRCIFFLTMCPDNCNPSIYLCDMLVALEIQYSATFRDVYLIEDVNDENIEFNQQQNTALF